MRPHRSAVWTALAAAVISTAACSSSPPGLPASTLEQARTTAAARSVPILLDFHADWCQVCATFAADAAVSPAIKSAMGRVVTLGVDVESPTGSVLAARFGVEGLPTFVVLNGREEELSRWSGYVDADDFARRLDSVADDPVTLAERSRRFEKEPTLSDALILAEHHASRAGWVEADRYYRHARMLDPDPASAYEPKIVAARLWGSFDDLFTSEEVLAEMTQLFASQSVPAAEKASLVGFIFDRFERGKAHRLGTEFIDPALALLENVESEAAEALRPGLEIARALHVENDEKKAAKLVARALGDGWRDDPVRLNEMAWWSFENEIELYSALEMIERGLNLVADENRAMLLDTRAEILFKLGRNERAVETIAEAIELEPANDYYRQQLLRFTSHRAPIL